MSERDEIVVATVEEPGGLREIDGVKRISGTELGRRLEYSTKKPALFNKQVIERLLKEGKLNDSDIVFKQNQCRKGFGHVSVTEYWLTLPVARSIALEHVRTPQAAKLRKQVVEELEAAMREKTEALQAPTADYATLALTVQSGFDQQAARDAEILDTVKQLRAPASVYIDEDRIHLVKRLSQEIVSTRGEGTVHAIWKALRLKHGFIPARKGKHPRLFDTITVDCFSTVLAELRADLQKALNAPNRMVATLVRRVEVENSVDVDYVAKRLKVMLSNLDEKDRVEVPAHALAAIYGLVPVEAYESCIDESKILDVGNWCAKNAKGLKVLLKELEELHRYRLKAAASGRRRGAAVAE